MKKKQEYKSIILFDGFCNLCSWSVNFILKRERKDFFRFASLQSEKTRQLLNNFGLNENFDASVILIENEVVYMKSEAALRITKKLRGAWPLLYVLLIIPKTLRDYIYTLIAKNRFKWFGKRNTCYLPEKNLNYKFL